MKSKFILGALMLGVSFGAIASDAVQEAIRSIAPNVDQVAVAETPIPGIYEVHVGSEVVYMSEDAKYLMQGRMIELETRLDLTERAKAKNRQTVMKDIDRAGQIVFAPDDPVHELIVFTDIDCGYCRRLHGQIDEYNQQGIAVRYMMFPRAGSDSHSFEKAVSVWCAEDSRSAMTYAKQGNEPDPLQCDNPIQEQYELGIAMGVTGTPALFTADGTHIPGYVPPEDLRQRLDSIAAAAAD